ncbi:hypothetical protein GCK32_019202 [Trichostrongylus colubriformis]|uniref:Uncharacterized protein n=1 Tax=Trichostrongylus colubriformis TaxID=6319 RepID=A0AAN8IR37_TRICO
MSLCCYYTAKNESEIYRCLAGDPLKDTNGNVMRCNQKGDDATCNRVEGKDQEKDKEKWGHECVKSTASNLHICCPG